MLCLMSFGLLSVKFLICETTQCWLQKLNAGAFYENSSSFHKHGLSTQNVISIIYLRNVHESDRAVHFIQQLFLFCLAFFAPFKKMVTYCGVNYSCTVYSPD